MTTVAEIFAGREDSARLFETLRSAIAELGPTELRATRSQIAFRRQGASCIIWR